MPVKKCSNGKWQIGEGPCMYNSKEKAESAYKAYLAQKNDDDEVDDALRGKYQQCVKKRLWEGYSEEEAKLACAKYLRDADETTDKSAHDYMYQLLEEHPDWEEDKIRSTGYAYEIINNVEDAKKIAMTSILKRSRSIDLAKFSNVIKNIKIKTHLKVGAMGLLPQAVWLPMKNLNRLQTKLEKVVTQESKWLSSEKYEQRKNYARYMRKEDSEEEFEEMTDEELIDALEEIYDAIVEYYPNMTPDEAIDMAFEPLPPQDKIFVSSNDAQIISANSKLNNIIKAPIILATEMVQDYVVREDRDGQVEQRIEKHFKPYEELYKAALMADEIGSLDIIIEHQEQYEKDQIIGKVKMIRGDETKRCIRGMGYFYENKMPESLSDAISKGELIGVSIGFLAKMGEAGEWNGVKYDHKQEDIILRHLAICIDSVPRCPTGVCGINIKDSKDSENGSESEEITIINKDNYLYNICKIFRDSKTETNTESQDIHIESTSQEDSQLISDDPQVLEVLEMVNESDNIMEEKEFQDAIAKRDSEIESLRKELIDAKESVKVLMEEKRQNLIDEIKKFSDKYSNEELQKKEASELKIIEDAVKRFAPSQDKPDVLPVGNKPDEEKMKDAIKNKPKRIDPTKLFDDVNKEFDMSRF